MYTEFDRRHLSIKPLAARPNKVVIERDCIRPTSPSPDLVPDVAEALARTAGDVRRARDAGRPVVLAFGAHTIKNGLGPVLEALIERGWVTHLATNGAGVIHDWEFAFQGQSSEDVRTNVAQGQFGIWEETGRCINLALLIGAWEGRGYGESVGAMIEHEGLDIPSREALLDAISHAERDPARAAAAADLLARLREFDVNSGRLTIPHPYKAYSIQAAAFRRHVPFTSHPMFGHDIIYAHPMNHGAAIGRTAERDFLRFAQTLQDLNDGVYLSVGSAIMSPMIFEKCFSMAQNVHLQSNGPVSGHTLVVVDLAEATWNWERDGEPPADNPAYYLRFCKTFHRMGGTMRYVCADNRDFLLALSHALD